MSEENRARCVSCGVEVSIHPPNLPPSGGAASFHDHPERGWQILEFTCGRCWERRPKPLSTRYYPPDPGQLAKEAHWRQREAEAQVAEWDREYPGWRFQGMRRHERL